MKKILRDNNGSISALVVISVLLYSIVLTTAFMQASSKRKMQMESQILAKEAYEKQLDNLDEIRDEINGGSSSILNKIQIGDSVNYTYDSASSSYTLESKYSGNSSNQTIAQTTGLTWKVLNVDKENDTVDIISTNPTSSTVYFYNILGYNNGPYLMNEICKAQYSNKTLGVNARSINLLDMEKQLTAAGIKSRNEYDKGSSTYAQYGTTKTYTSNTKYPSLYANQKGAGPNIKEAEASKKITQPDTTKGNDPYEESKPIATTEPTTDNTSGTGNPLTVTQTYYSISINEPNYGSISESLCKLYTSYDKNFKIALTKLHF